MLDSFIRPAQGDVRPGVVHDGQRREGEDPEGPFLTNRFRQSRDGVVVRLAEIGQRAGGVKPAFQKGRLQAGLQHAHRFSADRLQLQRCFLGGFRRAEFVFQPLDSQPAGRHVLVECDVPDHLQIPRKVVLVLRMDGQHDLLVVLRLRHRFLQAVPVIVMEPLADGVGDADGIADAAEIVPQEDGELPFPRDDAAPQDAAAAFEGGRLVGVGPGRGDQHRSLNAAVIVPQQRPFAGNHHLFGEVGFHEPAPFQAARLGAVRDIHFDVDEIPLLQQRR